METSLWRHFYTLPDPRVERTKLHSLEDIVTIAICAVICGAETFVEIELFGREKESFFRTFLKLPNGIPSHDTFGRVFAALLPSAFERSMMAWVMEWAGSCAGKHIAIDGKTLRRSMDRAGGKAGIHMISAWVCEDHVVFGQLKVDDKSNEITAIPQLMDLLELKDSTVTIDAMGCQKDIAGKVVEKGGDYVLAVKGNQETLHEDVKSYMDNAIEKGFRGEHHDVFEKEEKGHGRIEKRTCWVSTDVAWLNQRHAWPNLNSIVAVDGYRNVDGKESTERRYFISSRSARQAKRMANTIRNHWGVENNLHWCLDMGFNEDASRVRVKNAAENLSRLRRIALMLLKRNKSAKVGIKAKRLMAGWNNQFLLEILKN